VRSGPTAFYTRWCLKFVQSFGPEAGHVRLVYGVYSLPIGAPVIVDVIFEIEPVRQSMSKPNRY